jgi:hypothetical protein
MKPVFIKILKDADELKLPRFLIDTKIDTKNKEQYFLSMYIYEGGGYSSDYSFYFYIEDDIRILLKEIQTCCRGYDSFNYFDFNSFKEAFNYIMSLNLTTSNIEELIFENEDRIETNNMINKHLPRCLSNIICDYLVSELWLTKQIESTNRICDYLVYENWLINKENL